ncbi:MAG: hypothetical protein AAF513_03510 [Pseudomonadota bacterium]
MKTRKFTFKPLVAVIATAGLCGTVQAATQYSTHALPQANGKYAAIANCLEEVRGSWDRSARLWLKNKAHISESVNRTQVVVRGYAFDRGERKQVTHTCQMDKGHQVLVLNIDGTDDYVAARGAE